MYCVSLMISMHEKEKVIDERRMCPMNRISFHFQLSMCRHQPFSNIEFLSDKISF
jgi:hypothetical protein